MFSTQQKTTKLPIMMNHDSELLYPHDGQAAIVKENNEILQMSQKAPVNVTAKPIPLLLGPENTITICPFCNANIKTAVKYRSTSRTHLTAAVCCLICCCCCIPYCLDSAKNSDHYCPNCNTYIGTYEK